MAKATGYSIGEINAAFRTEKSVCQPMPDSSLSCAARKKSALGTGASGDGSDYDMGADEFVVPADSGNVMGDANGDGLIDSLDATLIKRYSL